MIPSGDFYTAIRSARPTSSPTRSRPSTNGIVLTSGKRLDADIVVTATGLELVAMGGATISIDGAEQKPGDHHAYRGYMIEDVPTWHGPSATPMPPGRCVSTSPRRRWPSSSS